MEKNIRWWLKKMESTACAHAAPNPLLWAGTVFIKGLGLWGNSRIQKVVKRSVEGILEKCLKLKKEQHENFWRRITRGKTYGFCNMHDIFFQTFKFLYRYFFCLLMYTKTSFKYWHQSCLCRSPFLCFLDLHLHLLQYVCTFFWWGRSSGLSHYIS